MRIARIHTEPNWKLTIISDDGITGTFDIIPYLGDEAFLPLKDINEFKKIYNGSYFIEWACGADLSVDTYEAKWQGTVSETDSITDVQS
jgi:hypothetical protein